VGYEASASLDGFGQDRPLPIRFLAALDFDEFLD
jgi:hypothetical protein